MKTANKFISWIKSPSSDVFLFLVALVLLNLVASKAFFSFLSSQLSQNAHHPNLLI